MPRLWFPPYRNLLLGCLLGGLLCLLIFYCLLLFCGLIAPATCGLSPHASRGLVAHAASCLFSDWGHSILLVGCLRCLRYAQQNIVSTIPRFFMTFGIFLETDGC